VRTGVIGRWRPAECLGRDEGTSLIELVVGMVLMSIFGGLFTGAIVMMNNSMNKSQAVNQSSSQLNQAFLTLDKTIRYASAISTPGLGTATPNEWYVELRSTYTGTAICTQLRVDDATKQLQSRTWTDAGPTATASAWLPLASNVTNGTAAPGASTQPFFLVPSLANTRFQQLRVNLISPAGSGVSLTTSLSSFTFSALNSIIPVPTTAICTQQVRP
jgi:type II secretory pathway pseudopilin PulG